ncbi:hypothetical protein JCM21900_003812, partial [Sporobolomyces salmonicolor]
MLAHTQALVRVALVLLSCLVVPSIASSTPFTNNWAVLVCTSRFWFNYR